MGLQTAARPIAVYEGGVSGGSAAKSAKIGEEPAGLFAGDGAAAGDGGLAGVGDGARGGEQTGGEVFGLALGLDAVHPLPRREVEARAGVQEVVADGVGGEPAAPVFRERLIDANGAFEDDLADPAVEAPRHDLEPEAAEERREVCGIIDPLALSEGASPLECAQTQPPARRLPRT